MIEPSPAPTTVPELIGQMTRQLSEIKRSRFACLILARPDILTTDPGAAIDARWLQDAEALWAFIETGRAPAGCEGASATRSENTADPSTESEPEAALERAERVVEGPEQRATVDQEDDDDVMFGRRWTEAEELYLREAAANGERWPMVARKLNRTVDSIKYKARNIGLENAGKHIGRGYGWTDAEDAILLTMKTKGETETAIARALPPGRTVRAISQRWRRIQTRDALDGPAGANETAAADAPETDDAEPAAEASVGPEPQPDAANEPEPKPEPRENLTGSSLILWSHLRYLAKTGERLPWIKSHIAATIGITKGSLTYAFQRLVQLGYIATGFNDDGTWWVDVLDGPGDERARLESEGDPHVASEADDNDEIVERDAEPKGTRPYAIAETDRERYAAPVTKRCQNPSCKKLYQTDFVEQMTCNDCGAFMEPLESTERSACGNGLGQIT